MSEFATVSRLLFIGEKNKEKISTIDNCALCSPVLGLSRHA
jgi:hypothetical protein